MIPLAAPLLAPQPGVPVVMAEEVLAAAPLSDEEVLCIGTDGTFFTVSTSDGSRGAWRPDRSPEDDGWEGEGFLDILEVSPDGEWVCWVRCVSMPWDFMPDWEGPRGGAVVYVSRSDGSGTRGVVPDLVVGGGPDFAFTSDSRYLVGTYYMPCSPVPEALVACWDGEPGSGWEPFTHYEMATGSRLLVEGVDTSDGFWKSPFGESYRIENNWYAVHEFGSFDTGGVTGRWETGGGDCRLWGWVSAEAMLYSLEGESGLVRVDGTSTRAPEPGWELYCALPDGRSVYSRDSGGTVMIGRVDWESFREGVAVRLPGLESFEALGRVRARPTPGSTGLILCDGWDTGILWFVSLP